MKNNIMTDTTKGLYKIHLYSDTLFCRLQVEDEKAKRTLPDFNAMYYGTPDPDWFVR